MSRVQYEYTLMLLVGTKRSNITIMSFVSISCSRRAVLWTLVVAFLAFRFWNDLVQSLGGSTFQATLVILLAWACGSIDVNDMVGQPHDD
jgi:hypothetical protein